ncbi:MAG: vWA domain-containing protein [Candidatus Sericytochromatia bacterium]
MRRSPSPRLAVLLAFSLTGCAMPTGLTADGLTSFAGGKATAPASGPGSANPADQGRDSGEGNKVGHGEMPAPQPTSGIGNNAGAPTTGGQVVPGVGLSTFFDTYNFNFPIPENQAVGTVANVSHAHVAPEGGKVYLQIGLQTIAQALTKRQPINVSFVFDKSGSMFGEKIAYTKLAAQRMIDTLAPEDTFSLVTFDTHVEPLIGPSVGSDQDAMKALVEAIRPGSQTNIDGGLAEGYTQVQKAYKSDRANRVILMSDGAANVGITDPAVLGERAAAFAREGVTLTTIGVGLGFQERFMTHLATEGQGSFYFVNSSEEATQAFVGEVEALQRTVAKNVKLDIRLAEGVEVLQVFGHSGETVGQSLNVDSNDLTAGQSKVILLELKVPAGTAESERALANVTVDFDDVPFGGHKQATASAKVRYSADSALLAQVDTKLASSVIILQTASHLIRAAELLDGGQIEQARTVLAQQLEVVTAKAEELEDQDLKDEVANLRQYLDRLSAGTAEVLKKELQFDAFQKQQGKKKVVQPAA